MQPTFSPIYPEWRGNSSSQDMNQGFEEILYDLNVLFNSASQLVVELNDVEARIRADVKALGARMLAASGIMTAYEASASGYKMFHEDMYLNEHIVFPDNVAQEDRCAVSNEFGVVTLPVSNSFSKVYTIALADGKITTAPDLNLDVTAIDEDGTIRVDYGNAINAFDGGDSTVWERKVRFNRDYVKDAVSCQIDVTLPSVSNPYVNKFFVKPFPEGTLDVLNITYDTTGVQNVVLPSFPAAGENNIRSKMYSFNNIIPTKFHIVLRQRNHDLEEDTKTFVYGAKEFGIEKVEYKTSGKFGILFQLPDYETGLLKTITSLRTNPIYDNSTYRVSLYTVESDFHSDIPIWTSANAPITATTPLDITLYITDKLWVMIELTQSTNNTGSPLFESVTMTYTTI